MNSHNLEYVAYVNINDFIKRQINELLSILDKSHSPIFSHSNELQSMLQYAIEFDQINTPSFVFNYLFPKICSSDYNINHLLITSCYNDNISSAFTAITSGADINFTDEEGDCPLRLAYLSGNFVLLELLLRYGANPNIWLPSGDTMLGHAVLARNFEVVELLLNFGASKTFQDDCYRTPVIYLDSDPKIDDANIYNKYKDLLS